MILLIYLWSYMSVVISLVAVALIWHWYDVYIINLVTIATK